MKTAAVALLVLALAGPAGADWRTDPAHGARRNAYGPGQHMDATGRLYRDQAPGGAPVMEPVRPNVYGPGIGADATGRPVRPDYQPFQPKR